MKEKVLGYGKKRISCDDLMKLGRFDNRANMRRNISIIVEAPMKGLIMSLISVCDGGFVINRAGIGYS